MFLFHSKFGCVDIASGTDGGSLVGASVVVPSLRARRDVYKLGMRFDSSRGSPEDERRKIVDDGDDNHLSCKCQLLIANQFCLRCSPRSHIGGNDGRFLVVAVVAFFAQYPRPGNSSRRSRQTLARYTSDTRTAWRGSSARAAFFGEILNSIVKV